MKSDPTIEQMREIIINKASGLFDSEVLDTSGEIAIYYFSKYHYNGQGSNLYSALCQTGYTPSILGGEIENEEDESIFTLYNMLLDEYNPESEEYFLNENGEVM